MDDAMDWLVSWSMPRDSGGGIPAELGGREPERVAEGREGTSVTGGREETYEKSRWG